MRIWAIAAAALALCGHAWAADTAAQDTGSWIEPKYDALKARWPHDAQGQLEYGEVTLDCGVGSNGFAADCKVKTSTDPQLEQPALTLAPLYKARDPKTSRAIVDIDLRYDEPADWLKKPTFDQVMAVYPGEAMKRHASGGAVIKCIVQTTGLTRACVVLSEDGPDLGFGPAAIVMSRLFLFKPALRHGQPVESEVTIPVRFATPSSGRGSDLPQTIRPVYGRLDHGEPSPNPLPPNPQKPAAVLGEMIWTKTPTVAEIMSEIDKKVGDKFAEGQVAFQCRLDKKTAKLTKCVIANASPGMMQFQGVAKALVPKFEADMAPLVDMKGDIFINLAFAFPDMASQEWGKRYLTHPRWTRTISPDTDKATFPEQAAKAGLKTGTATVDCVVEADGRLSHCDVVRESTPNLGFGDMAKQIAQTFVANPWDENGLPVDGAHVRMPIQMDYSPPADASAATPTPATKP